MRKFKMKKLVLLTTNNQIAIPAFIVRSLKLHKGSYLEVEERSSRIVITPKQLVDHEDYAMYRAVIEKGHEQLEKGDTVDWEDVKKKLDK